MNRYAITAIAVLFLIAGCDQNNLGQAPIPENYPEVVEQWAQQRVETLKEPTGWLRLAGMYILEEGENSFGSGREMDVVFPEGKIDRHAGTFLLENGEVTMTVRNGVSITHNGEEVSSLKIYDGENAPELQHGDLEWFVIQRGDLIAIRLYNKDNEKADNFTGFPRYDVDESWRLKARYNPNPENTTIPIVNVLNQTEEIESPGVLEFKIDGEKYTLDALASSSGRLFLIVGDLTNRDETYQAGRYMYIDPPADGGEYTVIDFNKIYNPPCAFNTNTTCQFPPPQNRLDVAITAGEKRPIEWEGL